MTFRELLERARSEAPEGISRLDIELLLARISDCNRTWLLAHMEDNVEKKQQVAFEELWAQRRRLVPLAYLTGVREFFGYDFVVDSSVLIPRPETELLVELVLSLDLPSDARVLDLGTGSGALAVVLAVLRQNWQVDASDVSADALALAKRNACHHAVEGRLKLVQSDWFADMPWVQYDVIVSNPPYVRRDDPALDQASRLYEPELALYAGEGGLAAFRAIFSGAGQYTHQESKLVFEHGYDQRAALVELAGQYGYKLVADKADIAGIERVAVFAPAGSG